jgi:hypothetical protein
MVLEWSAGISKVPLFCPRFTPAERARSVIAVTRIVTIPARKRTTPAKVLLVIAAMALALGYVSGCASIAAYQANHPYYKFPGGGGGGGGNGG